jgi:hypothetical protein
VRAKRAVGGTRAFGSILNGADIEEEYQERELFE